MAASDHDAMTIHEDEEDDDDPDDDDDATTSTINNDDDHDEDDRYPPPPPPHHQHLPHTLSRLSVCTSKSDHSMTTLFDNIDDDYDMRMYMSRLSMEEEGSDGDADDENHDDDDEFSDDDDDDGKEQLIGNKGVLISDIVVSSDSDHDGEPGCYSLPATPPRRRSSSSRGGGSSLIIIPNYGLQDVAKEYASCSENHEVDHRKGELTILSTKKKRNLRRRRILREQIWLERANSNWDNNNNKTLHDHEDLIIEQPNNNNNNSRTSHRFSGGDDELIGGGTVSGGGGGDHNNQYCNLVIMSRPSGGRRSLCMDFEEVKACRDLGFELEHERMMLDYNNISSSCRISMINSSSSSSSVSNTIDSTASTTTTTTTSTTGGGGNSPIASWRISSPGDDPKDVKARLKVWAQAVALASASHSRLLG